MWTAKFRIKHDCWITPKTKKYGFSSVGLPLNSFTKQGKRHHTGVEFLQGKEEAKKRFLQSLVRDKRVKEYSVKGNQLFVLIEGEDFITNEYDPSLFFVSPVLSEGGYEYWELGSWERKTLELFYHKVRKFADIRILKMKQEIPSLFLHQALPKMTQKQQEAFHLAQEWGYYRYPRNVSVKELAKKMNVPRTTFQEHLRKAEGKVMGMMNGSF